MNHPTMNPAPPSGAAGGRGTTLRPAMGFRRGRYGTAPPRRHVGVELGVTFVLDTRMTASVVADDEAMVLALLGLPCESEAGVEWELLYG